MRRHSGVEKMPFIKQMRNFSAERYLLPTVLAHWLIYKGCDFHDTATSNCKHDFTLGWIYWEMYFSHEVKVLYVTMPCNTSLKAR